MRRLHIDAARTCEERPLVASQEAITENLVVLGFAEGGLAFASCSGWRYQVGERVKFLGSWNRYTPLLSIRASFPTDVSHLANVDADCNMLSVEIREVLDIQNTQCFVSD